MAYSEKIYIYQPQFPTQTLSQDPELIIDSQPSSLGLSGYINSRRPHAINNLIVQLLGRDEVVAVVRDDGDVDAYFTRHIYQAIQRRRQPGNTLGVNGVDVKPFFQRNVGESAWGLAIHTEARMIAVSSNALQVTVYTFALTRSAMIDVEDATAIEEQTYFSDSHPPPPTDRENNDTRVIQNGRANIPSIAFCNTGHDPSGRWLISTDISGAVRSWDVHSLSRGGAVLATVWPTDQYRGESDFDEVTNFDRMNAGWGIMFLHPQSFHNTNNPSEAFGMSSVLEQSDTKHAIWDISSSVGEVRRNANRFVHPLPIEVVDGNYLNPAGVSQTIVAGVPNRSPFARVLPSPMTSEHTIRRLDRDVLAADQGNTPTSPGPAPEDDTARSRAIQALRSAISRDDDGDEGDEEGYDDSGAELDIPDEAGYSMISNSDEETGNQADPSSRTVKRFLYTHSLCPDLPCPILHASVTSLYLFQPLHSTDPRSHAPIITVGGLFEQELPIRYYAIDGIDRCNMYAQIPSLGIVIIATQKGRVAILSLTQLTTEAPDPTTPSGMAYKRVYGYRVDHILPFASQEAAGHRPPAPLHGIAVGPMQGSQDLPDELKRWRLIVMYQDHSVLNYEVGKARSAGAEAGGLNVII